MWRVLALLFAAVAGCATGAGAIDSGRRGVTGDAPGADAGTSAGDDGGGTSDPDATIEVDAFVPIDAGPACSRAMCDPLASCSESGGVATCTCPAGYDDARGDGTLCTDVDECARGTAGCSPMATCTNTMGGVSCACVAGYAGDGRTCTDVDECTTMMATCSPFADCANTGGSYTCTCRPGYVGDGRTCTPMPGRVLVYWDYASSGYVTPMQAAATSAGWMISLATDGPTFAAQFDGGTWSVIVVDSSYNVVPPEVTSRLTSWVSGGGRTIYSYWDLDADAATRSLLQVFAGPDYTLPRVVARDASSPVDLFAGAPASIGGMDLVADDGDPVSPTSGGFLAARLDSAAGPGAIVVTRSNRVVVCGFSFLNLSFQDADADGTSDLAEVLANTLRYLGP
jgi:hypothetical protein